MDLFTPIVPKEEQHNHFLYITEPGFCEPEIEVIKSWADGFIDRNGKLVQEFQTKFNSVFWELYLFACFKELGCSVDTSHETPDFLVSSPYGDFIAEAAIASNSEGYRPEWDKDYDLLENTSIKDILRLSAIRLEFSINKKSKKFRKDYSKLPHVKNKPFVICVAPFEQPFFFLQDSLAIIRVLYGYEEVLSRRDPDGNLTIIGDSYNYRVQKKPGFNVNVGLFTNSKLKHVSAVIFNNRATFCKVRALAKISKYPVLFSGSRSCQSDQQVGLYRFLEERPIYKETIADGLHILINPFAENPLNLKVFENREIALHNYDPKTGDYLSYIPNNFLLHRTCTSITSADHLQELKKSLKEQNYKELEPEIWEEDDLIEFGGKLGYICNNHMAHYKGWSVIVSLDSIDQDWSSIAIQKLCYSISEFQIENSKGSQNSILLGEFFSTKDEAYVAMKKKIDEFKAT
ncbi:hypothetical protein [Nostoc sp. NMS4]|uniref:hypothetical protein n=1 Tax=Nostoc sp. NMS4 TaxID=2815390 RepID=UPI0025F14190|nr:hypothetical protein [Nostoc sp. NMS4]MBN3925347.1 hypothetical protein [Nostoc sp. NMS4]